MNPEGWIVLAIGIATIASQVWAARLGAHVAERQLAASHAALRNSSAALLVMTRGTFSTAQAVVHVHNGGQHPAIDLRIECRDPAGEVVGSGRAPIVMPLSGEDVRVVLGTVERREAFATSISVRAYWVDGLAGHEEVLPLLRVE